MKIDFQRWTAKRKVELILRIIKGETTLVDICREQDLKQSEVEGWIEALRSENGLVLGAKDLVVVTRRISPYSPDQSHMIERFFRSPEEECSSRIDSSPRMQYS